ncbi:Type IV pilus biogenesis protein PilO [hydrothermal vent metagenome]|uniref:Type IV pilus biogenesis protein PilO n=1 Tax=hydrothermal vent metagenome TaxID=652676 RepID=A0A3B1A614_9ZZZZ
MKDISIDFNDLDINNIGSWPTPVKAIIIVIACAAALAIGYFLDVKNQQNALERAERQEITLKQDFEVKQAKAVNLEAYRQQMSEMKESFGTMLRQLPSKTEVENLLVDISQTGLASGIEFKLFKPEKEQFTEFYAELPIKISMAGTYHQFGSFVSGVAALPRIVTLHNIVITGGKDSSSALTMNLTAKTYRYLDEDEVSEQRRNDKKKRKGRR